MLVDMLRISAHQAVALAEEYLVRRITRHLQRQRILPFSEDTSDDLRGLIRHCFAVARGYAVFSERGLYVFTIHMLTIGPAFHTQPEIHEILAGGGDPEDERLAAIVDRVGDGPWAQASRRTDASAYWIAVRAGAGADGRSA